MPVIGKDKEALERYKQRLQERYEAVKKELDEIRLKLLEDKDYPLSQRTSIPYRVPIDLLITYPGLERQHSREYIESLKKSIEESGMLHKPICTLDFGNSNIFKHTSEQMIPNNILLSVVCGNARIQAAKELGYQFVDVLIKYMTSDEAFQMSLTENEEREELNPIDRALLFKNWIEKTGISQSEIARRRGKTQGWVFQTLKLLTLPTKVQLLLRENKISFLEAQKILQLKEPDDQIELAELCAEGLSAKALDAEIEKRKTKNKVNNILFTPAPLKPDLTPPRPVIPPSPKPTITLPKNPAEVIKNNIKKVLEEQLDLIDKRRNEFERYFPHLIFAMEEIIERCNGRCSACATKYICFPILKALRNKAGVTISGIDYEQVERFS